MAYLSDYARHFGLPVELNSRVHSISKREGAYRLDLEDRIYEADQVVIATGPFQVPLVPAFAERLDAGVVQLHSSAYRAPRSIPDGPVLVVGGGSLSWPRPCPAPLAEAVVREASAPTQSTKLATAIAATSTHTERIMRRACVLPADRTLLMTTPSWIANGRVGRVRYAHFALPCCRPEKEACSPPPSSSEHH